MNEQPLRIDISVSVILKIVLFVVGIAFLWFVRDMLVAFIVAIILAALIDPIADYAARFHIPRSVTALCVFVLIFGIIALLITLLVPLIAEQGSSFIKNVSHLWERVISRLPFFSSLTSLFSNSGEFTTGSQNFAPAISNAVEKLFSTVTNIIQGLFATVLTMVLAFYLIVQKDVMRQCIHFFVLPKYHEFVQQCITQIQQRLRYWLQGQLTLSLIIGILVYVGLLVIGVPYALLFAVLAAFFEIIPYIGPTLAALPPIFVAFASNEKSIFTALLTALFFIIIQQIENHFLVPKVMQKAVGLNPVISIIAVAVGVKLGGIVGGLLAIPSVTLLSVVIEAWQKFDRSKIVAI